MGQVKQRRRGHKFDQNNPKEYVTRRGEQHYKSKLTDSDVRQIRAKYDSGGISHRRLGEMYGVTPGTIKFIVRRQSWKHVSE